ncbi:LLM class flavin-dependent oxidoreductase [Roseobacter weihaiensis]|uniref:LLM class flavin-dependent oxidoreductase n=1 Tax=Roseobacter weihaiensis TaxID=2763262 RepID=UPI001D0B4273|nr:LLM class flavin-dependent oxidoreductase [Roseobacter sp. H9]
MTARSLSAIGPDPNFGDAGTLFNPWVYLGFLAADTSDIVLATAAVVLPLRHPLHTTKYAVPPKATFEKLADLYSESA